MDFFGITVTVTITGESAVNTHQSAVNFHMKITAKIVHFPGSRKSAF